MIGKILGTIFGFMFGRIPGAVLGFFVGHMFDKGYSKNFNQTGGFNRFFASQDEFKTQAIFFHCLFSVMGHVAKADGKVSDVEIRMASALMDQMNLEGDMRKEAQQAFRDGKAEDFALKQTVQEFKESSTLDISKIASGVYLMRIQDSNKNISFKRFIKE